ncbi:MAG: XRE family transcriptional regulator [Clostridiales bacterium]|nr:XRE family transcriptional regulator [Clostridiales bacterium]
MNIGEKIRRLRMTMGLTQEDLANRCELTKGFISQIERDVTSPSIATLIDILECLGTSLKDFFNEKSEDKVVFGKDDVFVRENSDEGHVIRWLVPNAQKNMMEPILIEISPDSRSSVHRPHEGECFGYVLKGAVNLVLGEKKLKVKKGESFYYAADASHYIENQLSGDAVVLWVCTPPIF